MNQSTVDKHNGFIPDRIKRFISVIRGWKLRNQIFLAILILTITPGLITSFQHFQIGKRSVNELVELHLESVVESRFKLIEVWLHDHRKRLVTYSTSPHLAQLSTRIRKRDDNNTQDDLVSFLNWATDNCQAIDRLSYYDSNWNVIATVGEEFHEEELISDNLIKGLENNLGIVADIEHGHSLGHVGVHFGHAVTSKDGLKNGYLIANFDLSKNLNPILQDRSGLWNTGKTYIMTQTQDILTEPFVSETDIAFSTKSNSIITERFKGESSGAMEYKDYMGNIVLGAALPLMSSNWIIVAEIDVSETRKWTWAIFKWISITISIALVFIVGFSMYLSRLLSRPLLVLAQTAHKIQKGDLEERLPPMVGREAEEVRGAFNMMIDSMEANQKEMVRNSTLAAVGELSANIAHEMRNALSSILMNIQALEKRVAGDSQDEELALIAKEQAVRLENMLNDLLQFGRPPEAHLESIQVLDLVNDAVSMTHSYARDRHVGICVADPPPNFSIYCDYNMLIGAIVNVLFNAADASPQDSEIILKIARSDAHVTIEIEDQGRGLPDDYEENIFKPFYSTKSRGTGLGLANAMKAVRFHGGTISAINQESGGARFTLEVPISAQK